MLIDLYHVLHINLWRRVKLWLKKKYHVADDTYKTKLTNNNNINEEKRERGSRRKGEKKWGKQRRIGRKKKREKQRIFLLLF